MTTRSTKPTKTSERPKTKRSSKSVKSQPQVEEGPQQLGWGDWTKSVAAPTTVPALPPIKPTASPETSEPQPEVQTETRSDSRPEPQVLTVGALNKLIRRKLEGEFSVVWLKGEISNFKAHPSGHFYFSLKDKDAQVSAVMFRGYNSQLRFRPEDGMEVVVRGKITVYEPRGNYQIMCETMEPVGAGALQKAFEQLKRKLQSEGLFDEARKRAIPQVPKHIALVTSPSGAAVRDMLNVLGRRYRAARITIVPCSVQGVRATREIVEAIGLANRLHDVDVLIVGRGGGSIEDMWSFNEEPVARAIAASRVPVISAVGHEVDFTIADFVADLRAPTPSAAAELVAQNAADLVQTIIRLERGLTLAGMTRIRHLRERVRLSQRLLVDPRRRIEDAILRCDDLTERLERAIYENLDQTRVLFEMAEERLTHRLQRRLEVVRSRFLRAATLLDGLSPLKVLDRGYGLVTYQGRALVQASDVRPGDTVSIRLAKGAIEASVSRIEK
ncbi:MAG: exodeoxyribonuclease VII large subunit [Bdellovibrionales bacterium]|jgi:exodeoxyribonuclease VII large subunit|nr:exodeoxyribonuclease VII large subunit [Bdellovibrionales bacterium]